MLHWRKPNVKCPKIMRSGTRGQKVLNFNNTQFASHWIRDLSCFNFFLAPEMFAFLGA